MVSTRSRMMHDISFVRVDGDADLFMQARKRKKGGKKRAPKTTASAPRPKKVRGFDPKKWLNVKNLSEYFGVRHPNIAEFRQRADGGFEYPDFYVDRTKLTGPDGNRIDMNGLFAKRDLEPKLLLPYYGRILTMQEVEEDERKPANLRSNYVMTDAKDTFGIDGDPSYDPIYVNRKYDGKSIPISDKGRGIAAAVNETNPKKINARLVTQPFFLGFATLRKIKKDEEILSYYGPEYDREYDL